MGQTFRLCILIACSLILFHCYQFAYIVTETPLYCWELHDVWLADGFLGSPFWMFTIVFLLLSVWVVVEWWVLFRSGAIAAHRVGVLVSALPLTIGLGVMQYVMWENLQIKAGSLSATDAWLAHYEKSTLDKMQSLRQRRQDARDQWQADYPNVPFDFEEFIVANSCDIGIERTDLTPEEWKELVKEFNDIRYRHRKELEREKSSNNLANQSEFDDED